MRLINSRGFSLLEILAVLSVFMILASVSVVAWKSFGPSMALNGAAEGLGDALELCLFKARTQKNEFFVLFSYRDQFYRTIDRTTLRFPANSYVLADDDGWDPTALGTRTRKYNLRTMYDGLNQEFRDEWIPDGADFNRKWRNNNLIESREVFMGPIKLGKGIYFQTIDSMRDTPSRLVFSNRQPNMYWHGQNVPVNRPVYDDERRTDKAKIYLSSYNYDPNKSSHDNNAHLRVISCTSQKVEIYRP